jgi:parallel beta-helix repeat protein/predicted outer membrane repeat protein
LITAFYLALLLAAPAAWATSFVLDGGDLTANLSPWGGDGYIYPLTFDATAPGGIDITFYDVDGALLRFNNINWGGSLKGTGIAGITAGTSINSIDPPNNSVWSYMLNQNTPTSVDWYGHATSTLGPDGIALTIDDTRSWLFQSWYRPSTGGKTGQPGYGDPAYNTESYVTPNPRFPSAPAQGASFFGTFDMRLRITHDGGNNYTAERWVRMHNSAATVEGASWVYNTAMNNSGNAWRQFENEMGIFSFPMSNLELAAVKPFVGVGNWETTSIQAVSWGNVIVNGTPTLQSEVWVDDDWTGLPNGTEVMLPNGQNGYFGYNAFANVQNGVNAVITGGQVHVASGNYYGQIAINKSLTLQGTGQPAIYPQSGPLQTYTIPESGARFEPVIFAFGGTNDGAGNISGSGTINVTLTGFNIDGNNSGTVNRFVGILARNCQNSLVDFNNIYEMLYSSGMPQTSGILIYGNSNIRIGNNTVNDWSRGGIIANGDNGPLPDPVVTISNNIVTGEGPLPLGYWAQNGIQVGYGAAGSITGNEVSEIACLDPNWSASAILLYYPATGSVLSGNNVHNTQGALNAYFAENLVINNGNSFSDNDFVFVWGGNAASIQNNTFTNNLQALYISDATNSIISGNTFTGNDYAIIADGACNALSFTANNITNSATVGALIQPYGPSPIGVSFNGNNISGNAFGIDNATSNLIDATGNWWGDATGPNSGLVSGAELSGRRPLAVDPAEKLRDAGISRAISSMNSTQSRPVDNGSLLLGDGDGVTALVDYSPWWQANYVGNPHITPWSWRLNKSNSSTIQEGVAKASPNDIINMEPGLYEAQVVINKTGLTLIGSGSGADSTVNTIIKSPPTLTYYFTTSANNYPIVAIHDVAGASLQNCRINGAGRGNSNYRFMGIGFWNAGGTVANCYLTGIQDTPFSGAQHGNGIYAYNNTGGPYIINITATEIIDAQKTGMALSGSGLTVNISGCTVTGHGPTGITAQNGIQVSYGAGGSISNCAVSNIAYTGGGWVASGMLFYNGTPVAVSNGSSITGGQACIVFQETNGSVDNVTIHTAGVNYEEGISVRDYGYVMRSDFGDKSAIPTAPVAEDYNPPGGLQTATPTNVVITNSTFIGSSYAGSYGVACWGLGGVGDNVTADISGSQIENWEIGIVSYDGGGGAAIDVSASHCSIAQNSDTGFWTNAANVQNAVGNWWDSYCGPYHPTSNPDGQGNAVSDNVAYDAWCNETFTRCDFSNSVKPSVVWVDDDYAVDGQNDGHYWCYDAFSDIQSGIAAVAVGGTVNVLAGTYAEQVVINRSLSMIGVGAPIIQCPAGTLRSYTIQESSARFEPVILAYGGRDDGNGNILGADSIAVTISGFAVDGNNSGTNYRFTAFLLRNCRNSLVEDNNIYEMLYRSGMPTTFGILVYGNSSITIDHNIVNDWSRNGITANGDDGPMPDPRAVITNNTVVGEGVLPQGNWAQNGIQIGFGASGIISGNEVSDIAILDPNWSASGIILYSPAPGIGISGNNVHDCQGAINSYYASNITIDGNNAFTRNDFIYILEGSNIRVTGNSFDQNNQALYFADISNATVENNTFNTNGVGIVVDGASSNITFSSNRIVGSAIAGAVIQPYGSSPSNVTFRANCLDNNAFGIDNSTSNMVYASGNWWGSAEGPTTSLSLSRPDMPARPLLSNAFEASVTNPSALVPNHENRPATNSDLRSTAQPLSDNPDIPIILDNGDAITSMIDYSPWWGADYVGDPHTSYWEWYLNPSNSSSIQEVVDLALSGDLVHVLPAVYSGTGNRNIDFGGKNIRLYSTNSDGQAIIDCQSAGRAFHFHSGENQFAVVNGFTIKNGNVIGNGGAILCEDGSAPKISFCLLINNRASGNGGAVYCDESDVTLINNTVIWNRALGAGGGLYVENSNPFVTNTILWEDTAGIGPEIGLNGGSPNINYSDIMGGWAGEGNLDCNPRFCEPDTGNFHVSDISCCMNGGFGGINIGAFELGCTGDFLPGDANASGTVNGMDVVYMINYFKDSGPPFPPPIWRADANGNCHINGLDVVYLVNYLKGIGAAPIDGDCLLAGSPGRTMPAEAQR